MSQLLFFSDLPTQRSFDGLWIHSVSSTYPTDSTFYHLSSDVRTAVRTITPVMLYICMSCQSFMDSQVGILEGDYIMGLSYWSVDLVTKYDLGGEAWLEEVGHWGHGLNVCISLPGFSASCFQAMSCSSFAKSFFHPALEPANNGLKHLQTINQSKSFLLYLVGVKYFASASRM